ncbi:hypothetical protein C8J57DRAFT_970163, partial [Mycena rebaudengoi]
ATAILLARQGAKVALLDYNVQTKRMIYEEVAYCDITVESACENAVTKMVELFGAVYILINI